MKMLVANSFDLWQKDAFFSAAEEVQESADTMESAYRAWIRERREISTPQVLDELRRELQTALGTAKWQLEEFEKAVRLSYRHLGDDNTNTRHKQFISAIESQISHVEAALRESYIVEGRQPIGWVNLDDEERDDLAAFLSGTSRNVRSAEDELENRVNRKDNKCSVNDDCNGIISADHTDFKDIVAGDKEENCVIDIKADAVSGSTDDIVSQTDKTSCSRKTWSSSNYGALRVVIPDEDEQRNDFRQAVDATPKEKGSKPIFWRQKWEEYRHSLRAVHTFNQLLSRIGWFWRQYLSPLHLRQSYSAQLKLALMLTVFVIVLILAL